MIYLTKGGKHLKKTLKAIGKIPHTVANTDKINEQFIADFLKYKSDTHLIIVLDKCRDADAVAQLIEPYVGKGVHLKDYIFDVSDKKRLASDVKRHADKIFTKIDKKIEKAVEKYENSSKLRDERGLINDVIDGKCGKSKTLKIHAKYVKIPNKVIKKMKKSAASELTSLSAF